MRLLNPNESKSVAGALPGLANVLLGAAGGYFGGYALSIIAMESQDSYTNGTYNFCTFVGKASGLMAGITAGFTMAMLGTTIGTGVGIGLGFGSAYLTWNSRHGIPMPSLG